MTTIGKIFGRNTSGEVGIELEYEGARLPNTGFEAFWGRHVDNSLRGDSGEYVLRTPIKRELVPDSLKLLSDCFKDSGTKIADTFRAGTHIHINVQSLTLPQVVNFLVLYFMFENTLLKFCRPDRTGNHFCLRATDAESVFELLYRSVTKGDVKGFGNDHYRYAAVNLNALPKFGSLEFRALESTTDWEKIKTWIDLHLAIKDASLKFRDPANIFGEASTQGFESFAKEIFGPHWKVVSKLYKEEDVARGVWGIQPVVFAKDWSTVNHNIFSTGNIFDIAS